MKHIIAVAVVLLALVSPVHSQEVEVPLDQDHVAKLTRILENKFPDSEVEIWAINHNKNGRNVTTVIVEVTIGFNVLSSFYTDSGKNLNRHADYAVARFIKRHDPKAP